MQSTGGRIAACGGKNADGQNAGGKNADGQNAALEVEIHLNPDVTPVTQVQIHLNPDVTPVIHLHQNAKDELQHLEDMDVI